MKSLLLSCALVLCAARIPAQDLTDYEAAFAKTGAAADAFRLCLKIGAPDLSARETENAVERWETRIAPLRELLAKRRKRLPKRLREILEEEYLRTPTEGADFADAVRRGEYDNIGGLFLHALTADALGLEFRLRESNLFLVLTLPGIAPGEAIFPFFEGSRDFRRSFGALTEGIDKDVAYGRLLAEVYYRAVADAIDAGDLARAEVLLAGGLRHAPTDGALEAYAQVLLARASQEEWAAGELVAHLLPGFMYTAEGAPWRGAAYEVMGQHYARIAEDDGAYGTLEVALAELGVAGLPDDAYFELRRMLTLTIADAYAFRQDCGRALSYYRHVGSLDIPIVKRSLIENCIGQQFDAALTDAGALDTLATYSAVFTWLPGSAFAVGADAYARAREAYRKFNLDDRAAGDRLLGELEARYVDFAQFNSAARTMVTQAYGEASAAALRGGMSDAALDYVRRGLKHFPEDLLLLRKQKLLTELAGGR